MSVSVTRIDRVAVIRMMRPERRNAVDAATAKALADAFRDFDADAGLDVAVFTGANDVFCAGADLKALASGDRITLNASGDSPMGPPRLRLSKPVIAAIEGPAVAGGLELVLWCDLRIAGESAIFGVFNRRFGIPLVDLGTIRLPRIIGHGRAMDLILTGRSVDAAEALGHGPDQPLCSGRRGADDAPWNLHRSSRVFRKLRCARTGSPPSNSGA